MARSVSISVLGDENFRFAVGLVAKRRGIGMNELTRAALDAFCGSDIQDALSFFESGGDFIHQSETSNTDVRHSQPTPEAALIGEIEAK